MAQADETRGRGGKLDGSLELSAVTTLGIQGKPVMLNIQMERAR